MTRGELLERTTSEELTTWMALFRIHAEEDEHRKHVADSGDGIVHVSGLDEPDDEDDEDDPGGDDHDGTAE